MMSGSSLQILLSLFFVFFLTVNGSAQASSSAIRETDSLSSYILMKYGLDQELINGFQYYNSNVQYKGNPYFPEDEFYNGSVTMRGVTYDNVQLKYDSYAQHLILKYTDLKATVNQLFINSIHIDSFYLGINCFHKLSLSNESVQFFQVLNSGPLTCYIQWKREAHTLDYDYEFKYTHEYSSPIGSYYISYRGEIQPIANRKELIRVFPESLQPEIKRYFRQQRLQLREAGPGDIQNLLNFISSRIETSSQH